MKEENIINPTAEQIKNWKAKYNTVHKLTIEDKAAYLRKPDRRTLSLAMSKIGKNEILEGSEVVLVNCWIGGDPEIKDPESDYFMAAINKVGDLIQVKEAELEKL